MSSIQVPSNGHNTHSSHSKHANGKNSSPPTGSPFNNGMLNNFSTDNTQTEEL